MATIVIVIVALLMAVPLVDAAWKHCKGTATLIGFQAHAILYPDDVPQHTLEMVQHAWKITCDCPELDGVHHTVRALRDNVAGSGTSWGYFTNVDKDGDKIFGNVSHPTKRMVKEDGSWEAVWSGESEYLSGTGKFQGIKGKVRISGKATPKSMYGEFEGDIWFPE
jgi:hypothetical protein